MTYAEFVRRAVTIVTIVIVTLFLAIAIWELASILLIAFTCWVLSVGLNALINRVQRLGIGRGIAALVVFLGVFLVIGLIVAVVLPPFAVQIGNLIDGLGPAVESLVQSYEDFYNDENTPAFLREVLPEFTLQDYNDLIGGTGFEEVLEAEDTTGPAISLTALVGSAIPILGGIGSFVGSLLANLTIIVLITGYLVADPLVYYRPFVAIVPHDREQRVVEIINKIRRNVIAWMGALSISIAVTSIAVTIVMGVILRIPNPVALGVLAGLGTLIPNLGYYIGLIPIIIFTAAVDPLRVIPAALLYWLINELEGKLLAPVVIKQELNIPAGVVVPFQLIAASVFGFFGILLAIPMLAIVITLVRELYIYDTLNKRDKGFELVQDSGGQIHLRQYEEEQ